MKKKKLLLIALLLVWLAPSFAAKVDTLLVKSPSMNKEIKVVVVTPDAALGKKAVSCPAVYLLHGFGAGTGIVRKIRLSGMKRLFHRSW